MNANFIFDTYADAEYLRRMLVALYALDLMDETTYYFCVQDIQLVKTSPSGMSHYSTGIKLIKLNSIFTSRGPR
jgi:hypothetical protein